jgi:hypothetical protein
MNTRTKNRLSDTCVTTPELINTIYELLYPDGEMTAREIADEMTRRGKVIGTHYVSNTILHHSKWCPPNNKILMKYRGYEIMSRQATGEPAVYYLRGGR